MPYRPKVHGSEHLAKRKQENAAARRARYEHTHGNARERGYTTKWQNERLAFLELNPLCKICELMGLTTAATVVDHVIPHKGNPKLFWSRSNWQALCAPHHNRKTGSELGGFGRAHPTQPRPLHHPPT